MNQEESIALWERGSTRWNVWANEMLAKTAEMKKAKLWKGQCSRIGMSN